MLVVKAAKGIKAPLAHKPKSYIPDERFMEVEDNHYYRSMVNDGDLIEAKPEEWVAQQKAEAKAEAAAIAADKKSRTETAKATAQIAA